MKHHLIAISSNIIEDSYEDGELGSTGCGYQDEKIGKTFDSLEAMIKYLHDYYSLSDKINDYEKNEFNQNCEQILNTSCLVSNHSEAQNGGWFKPTENEIEEWKKGLFKLYTETYTIRFLKIS
jgi:hypothetical protein